MTQERPGGRTGVPADGRPGPDQVDDRGHLVDLEPDHHLQTWGGQEPAGLRT